VRSQSLAVVKCDFQLGSSAFVLTAHLLYLLSNPNNPHLDERAIASRTPTTEVAGLLVQTAAASLWRGAKIVGGQVAERSSNIRQLLQDRLERKAFLPEKYAGSYLGLISFIGADDTHADLLRVEIKVTGWRRRMRFGNTLALEDTLLANVRPNIIHERTASQQHAIPKKKDAAGWPIHSIESLRGGRIQSVFHCKANV
jgi:hypothetical protein